MRAPLSLVTRRAIAKARASLEIKQRCSATCNAQMSRLRIGVYYVDEDYFMSPGEIDGWLFNFRFEEWRPG